MAEAKNDERRKLNRSALPVPPEIRETRANREIALFSHIWNYARTEGPTAKPNPCTGVRRYSEKA